LNNGFATKNISSYVTCHLIRHECLTYYTNPERTESTGMVSETDASGHGITQMESFLSFAQDRWD